MAKLGKLVVTKGEGKGLTCFVREGDETSIGRNLECSVPVPDIKLSRIHCIVRSFDNQFQILDNNSTNGTSVNGEKIEFSTELHEGDIIEIGDTLIEFTVCQNADQ